MNLNNICTLKILNKKFPNYKVVDRVEGYNFDIKFVFVQVYMKNELFLDETIF